MARDDAACWAGASAGALGCRAASGSVLGRQCSSSQPDQRQGPLREVSLARVGATILCQVRGSRPPIPSPLRPALPSPLPARSRRARRGRAAPTAPRCWPAESGCHPRRAGRLQSGSRRGPRRRRRWPRRCLSRRGGRERCRGVRSQPVLFRLAAQPRGVTCWVAGVSVAPRTTAWLGSGPRLASPWLDLLAAGPPASTESHAGPAPGAALAGGCQGPCRNQESRPFPSPSPAAAPAATSTAAPAQRSRALQRRLSFWTHRHTVSPPTADSLLPASSCRALFALPSRCHARMHARISAHLSRFTRQLASPPASRHARTHAREQASAHVPPARVPHSKPLAT